MPRRDPNIAKPGFTTRKRSWKESWTGTASSYARKYALNGLFCIDDTKDADTDEHAKYTGAEPKEEPKATEKQITLLNKLVNDKKAMLEFYGVSKIEDLTMKQASDTISKLKKGDK